jgi:glycogen operon protein
MHVGGFRFDLATSLILDRWGDLVGNPALPALIAEDTQLRDTKLIAEPWDIGGYQVGHFPGGRWAEWNDKYRDEIRQFWRGDPGLTGALATRLAGSADLYSPNGRAPNHSINFIAAHDGFSLNDILSYNHKHNEANGENNWDGHNHNISYNYGIEGASKNRKIEVLRHRQVKNFLATLLLSQGTPMLNGGDEFRRSQQGNNNAYCQDNEISWYDWDFLEQHADIFRFTKYLIALRQAHPVFRRTTFFTGRDVDGDQFRDIHWYEPNGGDASWDPTNVHLMCTLEGSKEEIGTGEDDVDVLLMFNANTHTRLFYIPPPPSHGEWHLALDTGLPSPQDIYPLNQEAKLEPTFFYQVKPRSMVVFIAR